MNESVTPKAYSELVAQLLSLGDPSGYSQPWEDYAVLGLTVSDVPELIRMATDESLHNAESDSLLVWAPMHAWRTLGELRAESAIKPLIGLFHRVDDENDDWVAEDLPDALGKIGAAAIPALTAYIQDLSHGRWAHGAACEALVYVAEHYPDAHDACVAAMTGLLACFSENDSGLNAYLISGLIDLGAVESAPLMEQAFKADAVDLEVHGDWEEVQIALGLLNERITPAPPLGWLGRKIEKLLEGKPRHRDANGLPIIQQTTRSHAKNKNKKKAQRKARKKNKRK